MPQAIVAGLTWAVSALGTAVGSGFLMMYAVEVAAGLLLAGGLAYSSAAARKAKRNARNQYNASQVDRLTNISSAVSPREMALGRVRKGGAVFYKGSTGSQSRDLYIAIALAGHEIDTVESIYLNDTLVTLSGNDVTTAPYQTTSTYTGQAPAGGPYNATLVPGSVTPVLAGREGDPIPFENYQYTETNTFAKIYVHLGGAGQTVDAALLAAFPADWVASNTVQGCAYLVVVLTYSENAFPSGVPNVTAVIRGAKIQDPRENLLTYSEQINNAAWTKNAVVTADAGAAPDGTSSAEKCDEAAASIVYDVYRTYATTAGQSYTLSIYFKAGERSLASLSLCTAGLADGAYAYFNLSAGTVSAVVNTGTSSGVAAIYVVGGGWYRCSITVAAGTTATRYPGFSIKTVESTAAYAGTVGYGIYVWGAQLVAGSDSKSYCRTTAAAIAPVTAWSENPALMMRHIYQHPKFGKASVTAAEDARFSVAANVCDTSTVYTVGGDAQPARALYRGSTVFPFGTTAKDAMDDLAQAFAGSWAHAGGEIYIKPGTFTSSVMSLTEADLAVVQRDGSSESQSPISISVHREQAEKFNTVKTKIWDAAQDYKQVDLTPLVGASLLARDGKELVQEVMFPAVGYAPQALHISAVMMRDARDALVVELPFKLRAYPLELFDTVDLTLARYGWVSKLFMVVGREWTAAATLKLTLKETAAAITALDSGFSAQGFADNTNLPRPWEITPVGTLTATSGTSELVVQSDGTVTSRMRVSWAQVDDAAVLQNGQIEVQYRKSESTGSWLSLMASGDETQVVTAEVEDGFYYTVRARTKTSLAVSDWNAQVTHRVIGKTEAPANVVSITSSMENAGARLSWTAVTDRDLGGYEIRYGGANWAASTLIATVGRVTDYLWPPVTAGSYLVRIKAKDTTGNYSTAEATTTVTISAPSAPTGLAASVVGNKMMLTWAAPATSSYPVQNYVIKYGASWAIGTPVAELLALTYRVPVDWLGGRTFYVAAVDAAGNEGAVASVLSTVNAPGAVTGVASAITSNAISLSWNANTIAAGMLPVQSYEVRRGTSFALGVSILITDTTRQQVVVDWATASETFWVRATDTEGNVGPATGNVVVSIGAPSAVTVTATIEATNALISWADSVQVGLPIAKYEVRNGASWAAGTLIASALDKTLTVPVTWVGAQTYWVSAVDTAGKYSTAASVVITVNVPVAPTINVSTTQVGGTLLDQYRLAWSESPVDGTRLPIAYYTVGYGATTLGTVKGTSWMAKAVWAAGRSFWVTAHDVNGNASAQSGYTLTVTVPTAPTTLTLQVVDNNVLMYWSGSTSTLPIESYELAKEATFNSSAPTTYIGKKSGGFTSVFETVGGTYTYYVRGIDTAGNNGASKNAAVTVAQPPDYVLNKIWNSTFSGTKSNAIVDIDGSLLLPVNLTQTWTTHFTDNAWTAPNDQIALYPNFAMPTTASGYYEEVFPYGTTLAASKITVTPTAVGINSPVVQCDISTSLDGVSYTTFTNVWSIYGTNFAYVKVRITVTATGANDQYDMSALNVTLDSKIKNDAGMLSCIANVTGTYTQALFDITVTAAGTWTVGQKVSLDFTTGAAPDGVYTIVTGGTGSFHVTSVNSVTIGTSNCTVDADGTPQLFNVAFIDVTSITVTAAGTNPRVVLYNFVDAANPTLFKVLLFDTAGARQPGTVSWSIKGY